LDGGSLRLPEGMLALAICLSYEIECTTSPQILLKFSRNLRRRRSEERIGFDKMEEQWNYVRSLISASDMPYP